MLLAAGLVWVGVLFGGGALAQEGPVVVGGSGGPAVEVDMGAVGGGAYGPGYSPSGRRLLMPNSKMSPGPVVLKPPAAPRTALKPPSLKPPKKQAKAPAAAPAPASEAAAPQAEPPPAPKIAVEPPPPPAKKVPPVESTALPPPEGAAKQAVPLEPPPPPPPPAPSAGKANGAPAAKAAKEAPAAEPPAPPPPPPPPEAKPANGHGAEAVAPPPPAAKSKNGKPAEAPSAAEGAPPPPPPPAAEAKPAEAKPAEVATLPPPGQAVATEKPIAIGFAVSSAAIADQAKQTLAEIAQTLNANPELRLQIVAYASGNEDNASQARRLSLSRALAVRSMLIDSGVRSTRMDVRALGNKFDAGPGDRVDLTVVKP